MKFDPDWILEQVAKAPAEFTLQARNPERTRADRRQAHGVLRRLRLPVRARGARAADATYDDFQNLVRLAQSFPQLDSPGGTICEPNDIPLDSRHLDMVYALMTLSDKPFMGSVTSGPNAIDTIAMAEIVFGKESLDEDARDHLADQRQLAAALRRPHARRRSSSTRRRGQATIVTPFLLMGAMSPVSVAGDARAAGRRGARRDRARADDPPRLPRRLRLVPLEHRHAVGLAELRHAGVGGRPALHRPDRAPLQPAVPRRRRADLVAGRRRAGRLRVDDVALADVPRRHELRHALGRLARVGARLLLREVRHRRRDACG